MSERGKGDMVIPTAVMAGVALVLVLLGYLRGNVHLIGLKIGGVMFLRLLPLLFFSLISAGMIEALIPRQQIASWIGQESGVKGILIGCIAGALTPGGPYVSLPVAAGFLKAGAGVGTMVAFITGWSLWAVSRLPMEVGVLGWKFVLVRLGTSFFFPPLAGLMAQRFFSSSI